MRVANVVESMFDGEIPVRLRAFDGSVAGPADAGATLVINSSDAFRRILTAPGELGIARAYVAGDIDVEGDIFQALDLRHVLPGLRVSLRALARMAQLVGWRALVPLAPPPEEARLRGRRHSLRRDREAISHHYDVGNNFYGLVLGPSMTYSCALWETERVGLDAAQAAKVDLVCRKLDLRPGARLLDVGCGWGSMVLHAARHYGVEAVGVTLSREQAALAQQRAADAGLSDRVEIRLQDYREIDDGPFDGISSIGMFEHVGLDQLGTYFDQLGSLLVPQGRLLNHGISRPWSEREQAAFNSRGFMARYIFPDGELHEVGSVVTRMQQSGFEVRHLESLREHYALTLRAWVRNLEEHWTEAVAAAGEPRCRVWRLYLAACAVGFEEGRTEVHQVLGVRSVDGASGMPLRPHFDQAPAEIDLRTLSSSDR
jgi:cyclopropane-fatty-acyl-phospholipid synthase